MTSKLTIDTDDLKNALIATSLAVGTYTLVTALKRRCDSKHYKLVGHVSDIMHFPVKGVRGNHLNNAVLTNRGMISDGFYDRSFVVFHEESREMCNSKLPYSFCLVKIQVKFCDSTGTCVVLSAPGYLDLKIDLKTEVEHFQLRFPVDIYGSNAENLFDTGDKSADWITKFINHTDENGEIVKFRIARFDSQKSQRNAKSSLQNQSEKKLSDDLNYDVTLGDGGSLLLYTNASLNKLNSDLTKSGSMAIDNNNFRANIIVESVGNIPFEEDNWSEVKIGNFGQICKSQVKNSEKFEKSVSLKNVMPCGRCNLPGIDTETGKQRKDGQPTIWLKENRTLGPDSHCFGSFFAMSKSDAGKIIEVGIGDPVYAKVQI